MKRLRRLIDAKPLVRIIEAYNGLTALIVENLRIEVDDLPREFDGIWSSSFTDSAQRGKPDIEAIDLTTRMVTVNEILDVSTKPLLFDADTGGKPEHFGFTVRTLERAGVSAVVIEDKVGLKQNSMLGPGARQEQDTIEGFSEKIIAGKRAQINDDFMIIARIESLVLGKTVEEALARSRAYIAAGTDGIMIHSRQTEPDEIFTFAEHYRRLPDRRPLLVVPSSYNRVYEHELQAAGVDIVVYANQMLRAAYPAMVRVAESILRHGRACESEVFCIPFADMLRLIPGDS
jgi:phosphoenolpyruvate phosphomutase